MTGLLDSRGQPMAHAAASKGNRHKDDFVKPPMVGKSMGQWAGRNLSFATLPGGGVMQFDLSQLTMADYRSMRNHYQLAASLNVLGFIMHEIEWRVECDDKKIAEVIEEDLRENWTLFIRAMTQSFWAGYSPIAVNYKNASDGFVRIKNFKDLTPEEAEINWRVTEGWAPAGKSPPKINHYDGFYHSGSFIPAENSLWYPLMMENGDHYGRKLLKPAFPSWFFSQLMHLFSNRYFERFGEPLPVGRAPFDDEVNVGNGKYVPAKTAMEDVVTNIRNRAVVVLPSDRNPITKDYEYSLEYLESQMRGADFERYMSRLDEEMSLALFTPVLLFRTADVGSYDLGQMHERIFAQSVNMIAGDWQYYLNRYLIDRLRVINFGQNSPRARWVYRKQGQSDLETYKLLMSELIRLGVAMPDLEELAAIVGLKWEKVEQLVDPNPAPDPDDDEGKPKPKPDQKVVKGNTKATGATKLSVAAADIIASAAGRLANEAGKGGDVPPTLGYGRRLIERLAYDGHGDMTGAVEEVYARVNRFAAELTHVLEPADLAEPVKTILADEIEAALP